MVDALLLLDEAPWPPRTGSAAVYRLSIEALRKLGLTVAIGCVARTDRPWLPASSLWCRQRELPWFVFDPVTAGGGAETVLRIGRGLLRKPTHWPKVLMDDHRNTEYLDRFAPTMMIVHKMPTAISFGIRSIRAFSGKKVMELHDDFPARYKEISRLMLRPQHTTGKEARLYADITKKLRHAAIKISEMRIKGEEAYAINSFDRLLVASTVEYDSYRRRTDLAVEIEFFPWPALAFRGSNSPVSQQTSKAEYDLGLIASDELFNIDAAKYLLRDLIPRLRSRGLKIRTLICGGVVDSIARDDLDEGVTLLRRVESVEEFYSKINLAVAPLRAGTGVSIKTLEALAFHRPVLGTPIGLRGLTPELRRFTVEFSSPDGFVDAVRAQQVRSGSASALSATLEQDLRAFKRRMDGLTEGRGAGVSGSCSRLS